MRTNINLIPVFCILLLCACKSGNASSQNSKEAPKDTITSFTLPTIPPMLTAPELRADFLVKHYWDNVNFADTNYVHHPEVTEQAWADYCDILNHVPLETAQQAIQKTIEHPVPLKCVWAKPIRESSAKLYPLQYFHSSLPVSGLA